VLRVVILTSSQMYIVQMKSCAGETPLDQAAWRGHTAVALLLLRYGSCTSWLALS
jgi:ankyrin repeat protein